jgi:hypothetical protein
MGRTTKAVSAHIKDATTSLLRWTGLLGAVGGLLGAGGLFGIDRMAANVASQRTSTRGRGVSIGEQSAFRNFERYGIDSSFLDTVNDLKSDPTKSWSLATLGVDSNGSNGDTAIALLKAMRQRAKSTPDSQLGLLDKQTGLSMGSNTWRTLHDSSDKEFNSTLAAFARDKKSLGVNDSTAEAWQNFTRQMQRAGQPLENIFVNKLVKLEPSLERLSSAFVALVGTVMGSQGVKDGIDGLAHWLDELGKQIETGKFQESVRTFIDGVGGLADTIKKLSHPLTAFVGTDDPVGLREGRGLARTLGGEPDPGAQSREAIKEWFKGAWNYATENSSGTRDAKLGLHEGTISKLIGQPDLGLPGYDALADKVYNDLYARELAARRNDSPNSRAEALQGYAAANHITIAIHNAPGNDISVTSNQIVAH